MGQPKKRTSSRRTGLRRSHLVMKLARRVNARSPVKVILSKRSATPSSTESKHQTATVGAKKT